MEDLIRKSKIYNYIKAQINPFGKPFEGDVYEFGIKLMEYIEQMDAEESVTDTNVDGKWILCSEKMPDKEYELYWTTHEDGSIVLHGYTKNNGFIYNWEVDDLELRKRQGRVVAWMLIPMPEPYKGE